MYTIKYYTVLDIAQNLSLKYFFQGDLYLELIKTLKLLVKCLRDLSFDCASIIVRRDIPKLNIFQN